MFPEMFADSVWQMTLGERAAVEGVLAQLRPQLAIEVGSMEGASLKRIAAYAQEVHSFDLRPPTLPVAVNVTLHTGDSHQLLPAFLGELEQAGRNVDFALVDGDHSAPGVRRDLEDLLNSRALSRTLILIHDTANEEVRAGVDAVRFTAWPKVIHAEPDWVPGRLYAEPALRNQLWGGLGLIAVDAAQPAYGEGSVCEQRYHPMAPLLAQIRHLVVGRESVPEPEQDSAQSGGGPERILALEAEVGRLLAAGDRGRLLQAELAAARAELTALRTHSPTVEALERELSILRERCQGCERALQNIKGSASWRMTEPLRAAKRSVRPADR